MGGWWRATGVSSTDADNWAGGGWGRLRDGGSCKCLVDSRLLIARMCIIVAARGRRGREEGKAEGTSFPSPLARLASRFGFGCTDRDGEPQRDAQFGDEEGKKSRNGGGLGRL